MDDSRQPLQLSSREEQLIKCASAGLTDTAIAYKLGISEATVGTYWGRVRIKLGPYNRTELVSIYLRAAQEEALNALRRENEQLVAELQRAALVSNRKGSIYEELIRNAADAIVLVSEQGVIQEANKSMHELFGYAEGELNGKHVSNLIPERFREIHREHRARYVSDPERRTMGEHVETPALRKDGTEILVRAALSAIKTSDGLLITCALRKAAEE